MLTNTDATLYRREYNPSTRYDEWERTYIPKAWWFKNEQSSVTADGRKSADVFTIRIPDIAMKVKKGDYVVRGNCTVEIQTVKELEKLDCCQVTSANYNQFGENPHIKVVGI